MYCISTNWKFRIVVVTIYCVGDDDDDNNEEETKSIYIVSRYIVSYQFKAGRSNRHNLSPSIMNFVLSLVACCVLLLTVAAIEVKDCKCWPGYKAKQEEDGKVMCYGEMLFALKPCNLPPVPDCKCDKEKITSILTEKDGTYCAISDKGELVKKWPCENEDEWKEYKVKYEEYEKSEKH